MSEFITLLENINSPMGWIISFFLFILPVMIGTTRSLLQFHNGDIRHYRTKNFELALSKIKEGSVEYDLLDECKTQELVYINTKLNLSKSERAQILEWLLNKPVSVGLIKKAWPHIYYENGQLVPQVTLGDTIFKWYGWLTAIVLFMFGIFILLVLFEPMVKQGVYQYVGAPIILFLLAMIVFKQTESIRYAGRLIDRLSS